MSTRALVVVDLQNEYLPTGKLALVGIEQALANAARVIAAFRDRGDLVVNVRHEAAQQDAPLFTPGTDGVRINAAVTPREGEPVIVKHFPNSFRDTPLDGLLKKAGVTELTIVGAMSHMCIDATARAAFDFGYTVTVVGDACATRALSIDGVEVPATHVHAAFMAALAFAYATVVSTTDLLSA